jgi:hypothetical protein
MMAGPAGPAGPAEPAEPAEPPSPVRGRPPVGLGQATEPRFESHRPRPRRSVARMGPDSLSVLGLYGPGIAGLIAIAT